MSLTPKLKRILVTSGVLFAAGGGSLAATATPAMAQRPRSECDAHLAAGNYARSIGMTDWADIEYRAAIACYTGG
jgi:hypothetical protein